MTKRSKNRCKTVNDFIIWHSISVICNEMSDQLYCQQPHISPCSVHSVHSFLSFSLAVLVEVVQVCFVLFFLNKKPNWQQSFHDLESRSSCFIFEYFLTSQQTSQSRLGLEGAGLKEKGPKITCCWGNLIRDAAVKSTLITFCCQIGYIPASSRFKSISVR